MVTGKTKVTTLNEILATRARAMFPYRINFATVGYQVFPKMEGWCENNCKGLWRCEKFHALYFQFENDHDATMFMLRWGSAEGNKIR
jgi:hypothetical protein